MDCPRCGFAEPGPSECPRCGVVFAKLDRPARPTPAAPADVPPPSPRARLSKVDAALLLALVATVVVALAWRGTTPATDARHTVAPPAPRESISEPPPREAPVESPPLPLAPSAAEPGPEQTAAPAVTPLPRAGLTAEDAALLRSLAAALTAGVEIESSHVERAEALLGRYPRRPEVGGLVEDLLERAAQQASQRGRRQDARRYRERAVELLPESSAAWRNLVRGHEAAGDWREAELCARRGLSALPDESALHRALARVLHQQGRDEDAADVLRRRLASRVDPEARQDLAELERELATVAGLARRADSHFVIRFEGRDDAALGSALLQVLEDKHSMLSRTFDFEPDGAITVILLSNETYHSTGAPDWSGANYSHSDRRIRVGTRGLSLGVVPVDLERTLTHELAHAFIHARTRGAISSELNEGLAQYVSGRRLGYRFDPGRAAVRDGRMKVNDFYDSALAFAEFLLERYGQSTVNEVLRRAGETGDLDQAFRRALGQSYDDTRTEWMRALK